jgi:class 3 adenylate cyclase
VAIIDEPVRGSIPPAWWWSLSGIERMQALARGLIQLPPLCRLLGLRPGHVGPGSCTWTMPATAWLAGPVGELDLSLFAEAALTGTAMTAIRPSETVVPLTLDMNHFRPIRPANGNFVARCRVINASRFFVYTEIHVEDPNGRQLLHGASHADIGRVEPEPPPAPAELRPVEEPTYPTPDPYLRPVSADLPRTTDFEAGRTREILESIANGTRRLPFVELLDYRLEGVGTDSQVSSLPASEWLCLFSRDITHGAVATLGNTAGAVAGQSLGKARESFVGLSQHTRFLGAVPADGRPMRAETTSAVGAGRRMTVEIHTSDFRAGLVATTYGYARFVDAARRQRMAVAPVKRLLCSLLFTDIVGSTEHAKRLGDQKWRALLDEQRRVARAEVARWHGTEIDTAGDGFFVRFDSPTDALDCANAARAALKPLGIEIRAGVHTGECEVTGRSYAGMAVHIAARIMAAAAPGEILVSSTVKDLVIGSGRSFDDRGEHTLKGVPGSWRLHALA